MPVTRQALSATSCARPSHAEERGSLTTSSALSGPKPPRAIATSCSPKAMTYAPAMSRRSWVEPRRPLGKARNACRNSTATTRSNAIPMVYKGATSADERPASRLAVPAAIMREADAALRAAPPRHETGEQEEHQRHPLMAPSAAAESLSVVAGDTARAKEPSPRQRRPR